MCPFDNHVVVIDAGADEVWERQVDEARRLWSTNERPIDVGPERCLVR